MIFRKDEFETTSQQSMVWKYIMILAGPIYVIMILAIILDQIGIGAEWIVVEFVAGFAVWIASIATYTASVSKIVAEYKVFNSAKLRLDETHMQTVDILFKESEMEYVGKTKKERDVYVFGPFTETFWYEHPSNGWICFNRAFIILPFPNVPWDKTFHFGYSGELWFNSIPTSSGSCEGATFHVSPNWRNRLGEWLPVFTVADSYMHYLISKHNMMDFEGDFEIPKLDKDGKVIMDKDGKIETTTLKLPQEDPIKADEIVEAHMLGYRKQITDLTISNKRLADSCESYQEDDVKIAELVDDKIGSITTRHGTIMRAKKRFKWRGINAKRLAIVLGVIFVALMFIWFVGG